jgi:hypothetical protein
VTLLLASLLAFPNWAPPSKGEVTALAAVELLIAYDIAQTVKASRMPGFYDANPLLGRNPSTERIILVGGLGGGLVTAGLWFALPPKMRYLAPIFIGAIEILAIAHNTKTVGFKIPF